MNKKLILIVMILILSACSKTGNDEMQAPTTSETTTSKIITLAKEKLAADEGISVDQIVMEKFEEVTFPNSCLGIITEGMDCASVITPGYKITLSLAGKQYLYHSNEEGTQVLSVTTENNDADLLDSDIPPAVNTAKQFLSNELSVKPTLINLISYEYRKWPDGCLGISEVGKMCIQVITPGYSITFQYQDQTYRLRTDQSGSLIKFETTKPQPGILDS